MKIEMVPTEKIIPYVQNPKAHPEAQIKKLAGAIAEFKWDQPIVVDRDMVIIKGHGRLMAAQALGHKEVPVVIREDLTPAQAKAARIADNKVAESEWFPETLALELQALSEMDFDLSLTGFDPDELEGMGIGQGGDPPPEDPGPQIDRAAELQEKWGTALGQIWQVGRHRVMCGDSTSAEDVGRLMGGEKVDCIFTSPPYAVGVDYGETYQDNIENLRKSLNKLAPLWMSFIKEGGFAVINFGDIVSAKEIVKTKEPCEYPMALEYWPIFRKNGWILWSRRIWCKPGAARGSMQCISSNRAATNWEHIWTWKKPGKPIIDQQLSGEFPSQLGWFDSSHDHHLDVGLNIHGAGMPVNVAKRMVLIHSIKDVHEPFLGTGTTLIAAEQLNRICYGMEIAPEYIAVILERAVGIGLEPKLIEGE